MHDDMQYRPAIAFQVTRASRMRALGRRAGCGSLPGETLVREQQFRRFRNRAIARSRKKLLSGRDNP